MTPFNLVTDVWSDECKPGDAEYYSVREGPQRTNYATDGKTIIDVSARHNNAGINFRCPGCGGLGSVAFVRPEGGGVWAWDGNIEKPTVTPSILHNPGKCDWHGFLTNGEFVR